MKPRFRQRFGVWGCVTYGRDEHGIIFFRGGYGRTPHEAWAEWEKQP